MVDAYVLRCIHRRCNYDKDMVLEAQKALTNPSQVQEQSDDVEYYVEQFNRSGMADAVILPYLTAETVHYLSQEHVHKLLDIINQMLSHAPFEVVTIH